MRNNRLLIGLLFVVSIVSLFNLIIAYWFPVRIPLSSLSVVKLMFFALLEKAYWLIPLSILLCAMLFLTGIAVCKRQILLPSLSLVYLIYDLISVLSLLITGIADGYWRPHIIPTFVLIILVFLLSIYCYTYIRINFRRIHKTGDGSLS